LPEVDSLYQMLVFSFPFHLRCIVDLTKIILKTAG